MIVTLKIQIECGENVCNPSIYMSCGHRSTYGNSPFCGLFGVSLQGKCSYEETYIYMQYQRCKECKEAQYETSSNA